MRPNGLAPARSPPACSTRSPPSGPGSPSSKAISPRLPAGRSSSACPLTVSRATIPGLAEPLTAREIQVLHLLAVGAPNQRIADDLVVTQDTVNKHVTHVLGKLGASNHTEAATRARQLGLIS
jgi:DNA-binding NarL/FixJ family response regulator